jgi:hypothetical protein
MGPGPDEGEEEDDSDGSMPALASTSDESTPRRPQIWTRSPSSSDDDETVPPRAAAVQQLRALDSQLRAAMTTRNGPWQSDQFLARMEAANQEAALSDLMEEMSLFGGEPPRGSAGLAADSSMPGHNTGSSSSGLQKAALGTGVQGRPTPTQEAHADTYVSTECALALLASMGGVPRTEQVPPADGAPGPRPETTTFSANGPARAAFNRGRQIRTSRWFQPRMDMGADAWAAQMYSMMQQSLDVTLSPTDPLHEPVRPVMYTPEEPSSLEDVD